MPGTNYWAQQSENSYFAQDKSGIVPISALRRTYDKQCVKSPVFGVQVVLSGLAVLTDRSVPSVKCIKCVKSSLFCVQVVLSGLAVLTDRSVPNVKCIKCVKSSVFCVQVVLSGLTVLTDTVFLLF